jgi:hypothetical protein
VVVSAAHARVFISYKRNVNPDQLLAREIVASLSGAGHDVFIDQQLTVGQAWAREIEARVRESQYLVVLLTPESACSEMVRGEIEIARHHAAEHGQPIILPVRLDFDGPLPYPLNAYIGNIMHATWTGPQDTVQVLRELMAAMGSQPAPPSHTQPSASPGGAARLPPAHAAPLPISGGTLDVDDPWYLPRRTDATALAVAQQPGQTVTIEGPRQMGKSSLLMRTVKAGLDVGKKIALLDFQLLDETTKADPDLFFRRFASALAEQLDLENTVDETWDDGLSNPQNCTRYAEHHILKPLRSPCILAIDETDTIFRTDFAPDFFSMLRSWHGLRAHPARRDWKKLDIFLSTSTEPHFFIDRPHESPFNVGVRLPLEDFTVEEVGRMNAMHPRPLSESDLRRVYALLGGHPFLTRKALYVLACAAPDYTVDGLLDVSAEDTSPFSDHLTYYLLRLQGKPELIAAFRQVIEGHDTGDEFLMRRMEGAGLVRRERNRVVPRCELYARYFREHLHEQD